ncbi:MAG TPA: aminotransferase class V-fold PLP-dependent enzyme [Allosphingosinicella sp.]
MKPENAPSRRHVLAGLAAAPLAGAGVAARAQGAGRAPPPAGGESRYGPDYQFQPGLTYLNTASLGPTPRSVREQVMQAWLALEANPVRNAFGAGAVLAAADAARGEAAALLGCAADEIMITRGTTEGMITLANAVRLAGGDHILTTDKEHQGGEACWMHRARREGLTVDRIPIDLGEHDVNAIVRRFAEAITPATRLISVSHVISTTGLRMPIAEISALARARDLLCVVDGAQAVGAIQVDVKALGCHAYATSGHKWLMGPKGTGLLYISRDAGERIEPARWALGHQYGSESTGVGPQPLAVGLGAAIAALRARGMTEVERHNLGLRTYGWRRLSELPQVEMVGPPPGPNAAPLVACRLPTRIVARGLRDRLLSAHDVVVKMTEARWLNGIRLSPHLFNTEEDIDLAVAALRVELG